MGTLIALSVSVLVGTRLWITFLGYYGALLLSIFFIDGRSSSRWIKRGLRIAMGVGLGLALGQIILERWIMKTVYAIFILFTYSGYKWYRDRHPSPDLCQTCEEFPLAPRCSGIIDKFEANQKYREFVLPVIDIESIIEQNKGNNH